MMSHRAVTASVTTLLVVAAAAVLVAGPLNPPAGPVAGSYKTLTEVEPRIAVNAANTPGDADSLFKITQPGSYYLTGNITGVAGKHGIEIAANGVTLDLSGFDLVGFIGMGSFDGVIATAFGLTNIAVINGSVRNWGRDGINMGDEGVSGCRAAGVRAGGNGRVGINMGTNSTVSGCTGLGGVIGIYAQAGGTLSDCSASGAMAEGIHADARGVLTNCSATTNGGSGIFAGNGCSLVNCSANGNFASGITPGTGCALTNCSATGNNNYGVLASSGCMVSNCSVNTNGAGGINAGTGCALNNCSATGNGSYGVLTNADCTLTNCSADSNTGVGLTVGTGCTVTSCSANSNTGNGIDASVGSAVEGCSVRMNAIDGIRCSAGCTVRANTCMSNGNAGDGAGIHAIGNLNRIEGNNCVAADRGIDVDLAANIIIRNTCAGNTTDWDIVANNVFGPILDRRVPASAGVLGFSAASTLGSTDPNANFSY